MYGVNYSSKGGIRVTGRYGRTIARFPLAQEAEAIEMAERLMAKSPAGTHAAPLPSKMELALEILRLLGITDGVESRAQWMVSKNTLESLQANLARVRARKTE